MMLKKCIVLLAFMALGIIVTGSSSSDCCGCTNSSAGDVKNPTQANFGATPSYGAPSITQPTNGQIFDGSPVVTIAGNAYNDGDGVNIYIDNGKPIFVNCYEVQSQPTSQGEVIIQYLYSHQATLSPGVHTVYVTASSTDVYGHNNVDLSPPSPTVTFSVGIPAATVTYPADGSTIITESLPVNVIFQGTGFPNIPLSLYLDSVNTATVTPNAEGIWTTTLSISDAGIHSVQVIESDTYSEFKSGINQFSVKVSDNDGALKQIITQPVGSADGVAVDSSGNIFAVGVVPGSAPPALFDPLLCKYYSGNLVKSVTPDFGSTSTNGARTVSIAILPDDSVVIAGTNVNSGPVDFVALQKFNNQLTPDKTFNSNSLNKIQGIGLGVALQNDGKIVVSASQDSNIGLIRFNSDGSVDTSYPQPTAVGSPGQSALVIDNDNNAIVGGSYPNSSSTTLTVLQRFTSAGQPDTAFNTNTGSYTSQSALGKINGLALQSNGGIIAVGQIIKQTFPTVYDPLVLRFNSDGTPDTTFNSNVTTTAPTGSIWNAVAIQFDGKIVVSGSTNTGGEGTFLSQRYNPDGTLDTTFTPDTTTPGYGQAMAIDNNGEIIIAGNNLIPNFVITSYYNESQNSLLSNLFTIDSPSSGSQINNPTPTFSGAAPYPSIITLTLINTITGAVTTYTTQTLPNSNAWLFTPPAALPAESYNVSASALYTAGNLNLVATSSFRLSTTPPNTPIVSTSTTPNITIVGPLICGTAQPGATISISASMTASGPGAPIGTTIADSNGCWSFPLPSGDYYVSTTATNSYGNTSAQSTPAQVDVSSQITGTCPTCPRNIITRSDTVVPTVITAPANGAGFMVTIPYSNSIIHSDPNTYIQFYFNGTLLNIFSAFTESGQTGPTLQSLLESGPIFIIALADNNTAATVQLQGTLVITPPPPPTPTNRSALSLAIKNKYCGR